MTKLPRGIQRNYDELENELIIQTLLLDPIFIESIEAGFGELLHVYADWKADHLVYDFVDGGSKYSNLTEIIIKLKDFGYMKEYEN